ncbi:protocatechuate 3,4-dioxygenase, beta subunit [Microdochium nivale]|nr:protocatechuate 3,4-dioxygenase, beta subunit [Microdochium nivale]
MVRIPAALLLLSSAAAVFAHPGEEHTPEEVRRETDALTKANLHLGRALKSCATAPGFAARQESAVARRIEVAHALRKKRGIQSTTIQPTKYKRDLAAMEHWQSISHEQAASGFSLDTPAANLFAGNASCALVPEQTIGPYFVAGELIREDITEDQTGVPLHVEIQFVNVRDCSAVPELAVDIWSCNATGVYSGIDIAGQAGTDKTWLRGVQISDSEGIAGFDTIFPGHYVGRTHHVHVLATKDPRVLESNQYEGGVPTHIGQFYFDDALTKQVESVAPYTSNQQALTTTDKDRLALAAATAENDIFMDYVMLGDDINDGVLAWIVVGIDPEADRSSALAVAATATPVVGTNGTATATTTGDAGSPVTSTPVTAGAIRAIGSPFLFGWRQ